MPAFSAQLRVAGHVLPVLRCAYQTHQVTDGRGRVTAKVRYQPVELLLDVPDHDVLLAWAADPHKRQAADIVFHDPTTGSATETLHLAAAYCVGYSENFAEGDAGTGAYQCHLTLSDPDVFTLVPGGSTMPQQAFQQNPFVLLTPPVQLPPTVLPEVAAVVEETVLARLGQGALRLLTSTAGMTAALLLTPTNSRDDPGYASEWEMYRRNMHHGTPVTPAQLRLAQLERLYEQGALTTEEEAELIALLAKVKGIHVQRIADLPGPKTNGRVAIPIFTPILPGEGNVGSYKELLDAGSRGDNLTPHHVPSDAYIKQHGIAKNEGICINMGQPLNGGRHRRTKTCGRNMTDSEREAYYKLSPKKALEYDIQDARRIFKEEGKLDAKMEQKLQEVLNQNRAKFPNLYNH